MSQEDKELLLRDLCARLPYGVMCHANEINLDGELLFINKVYNIVALYNDKVIGKFDTCQIADIKPYLRPMSSITDEEMSSLSEYSHCNISFNREDIKNNICLLDGAALADNVKALDWLNKNHFDYRGLIEKGLALEAPEDMYKTV